MKHVLLFVFLSWCAVTLADPAPLVIDKSIKGKSSNRYIRAVHLHMETGTSDLNEIRRAIMRGMLQASGRAWTYEGEGDGYILARFDYRGLITVMRIEYDQELVQLKYHSAIGGTECQNLRPDGICYKGARGFYNYTLKLREGISRELRLIS